MNKKDFVNKLSLICNLSQKKCKDIIDSAYKLICESLKVGEELNFNGFGLFYIKRTKERVVKSVYTKNLTFVLPKNIVCFKMSSTLKNIVK